MTISNPFFQSLNWQTAGAGDPRGPGNQQPDGWTLTVTQAGALLPWPSKGAKNGSGQSITVEAIAGGPGEYVHKLAAQLPANEQLGQLRALIPFEGLNKIYKGFGGVSHGFVLSQRVTETPGTKKQYILLVLAETPDKPTPPNADLEPDHFRVRFEVGSDGVESHYADMKVHKTIPGNERAWNKFVIPSFEFPPGGEAQLRITCQQNWPGVVDFFIGGVLEQTIGAPTTPPADTPAPVSADGVMTALISAFRQDVILSRAINERMWAGLAAIETEEIRRRGG